MAETNNAANKGSWLAAYEKNVYSQTGEDGVIEKVFEIIPDVTKWCVEFGAWDGKHLSNTYLLISEKGWSGILIEADAEKHKDLCKTYTGNERAFCLNKCVDFQGDNSLDNILATTHIPRNFDLLSIDIDGNDYHVWNSIREYRPKIVVIEFNPSIPNNIEFVQESNYEVNQGSSLLSLQKLSKSKGYELIYTSDFNAFFVDEQYFPLFEIADNSLEVIHDAQKYLTQVFQLFDGTLVFHGCKQLLWHGIEIEQEQVQMLPKEQRFLPGSKPPVFSKPSAFKKVWRRIFL